MTEASEKQTSSSNVTFHIFCFKLHIKTITHYTFTASDSRRIAAVSVTTTTIKTGTITAELCVPTPTLLFNILYTFSNYMHFHYY